MFTPDIDNHTKRLVDAGFKNDEIVELKVALRTLTETAIIGKETLYKMIRQQEVKSKKRKAISSKLCQ